jgi:regulator of ribonuclease activity A
VFWRYQPILKKSEKKDVGEVNIELNFFNTSFIPGHYLYADLDGLLVSKTKIDI